MLLSVGKIGRHSKLYSLKVVCNLVCDSAVPMISVYLLSEFQSCMICMISRYIQL